MYTVFDGERTGLERERASTQTATASHKWKKEQEGAHIYRIARIYLGNAVAGCIECQQSPRNAQAWAIGCPIKTKPDIFCLLKRHACIANRGYFPREMSAQLSNEFIFFPLQEGWRQTTTRCLSIKIHRAQGKPINFRVTDRNDYSYIPEDSRPGIRITVNICLQGISNPDNLFKLCSLFGR